MRFQGYGCDICAQIDCHNFSDYWFRINETIHVSLYMDSVDAPYNSEFEQRHGKYYALWLWHEMDWLFWRPTECKLNFYSRCAKTDVCNTAVLLNTMGVTFSRYGCDMSEIAGHRLQETSETSQYHVELSFYENISRGCQWWSTPHRPALQTETVSSEPLLETMQYALITICLIYCILHYSCRKDDISEI